MKKKLFAEHIIRKNSAELRQELSHLQKELDGMRKRRNELTALSNRLCEDNVLGHISDEPFCLLSADYNAEQKTLDEAIPHREERIEKAARIRRVLIRMFFKLFHHAPKTK